MPVSSAAFQSKPTHHRGKPSNPHKILCASLKWLLCTMVVMGIPMMAEQNACAAWGVDVEMTADKTSIFPGEPVTLSWHATNVRGSVSIDNGIGTVDVDGSLTLYPTLTTTYTISAEGLWLTAKDSVTVNVLPKIVSFTLSDQEIKEGESITLSWETLGADTCTINPTPGPVGLSGTASVHPLENTAYTLTATNASGNSKGTVFVSVIPKTVKSHEFHYDSAGRIKSIQVNETD